jgi:2',3'-cyclic-nucleotide 2'-phosphodiesterase
MTGSRASVLGVRWEQAVESFRTQMQVKFETASDDVWVNAVAITLGADGLAESIEQILEPVPE